MACATVKERPERQESPAGSAPFSEVGKFVFNGVPIAEIPQSPFTVAGSPGIGAGILTVFATNGSVTAIR
jgi:hypothetical protein